MIKKIRHMSKKLDIISLFLKDYSASFSGREIARQIKSSPQTALTMLKKLSKEKIVSSVKEGRNIKYGLNKKDLRTKLFLQLAEINKANLFLNNFELKSIVNSLLPFSETIVVFGSFAKALEKEESDLDLVIIDPSNKDEIKKIKKRFSREINVEFVTWKTFAKTLKEKNTLSLEIKKDHLVFGNVFKTVEVYCD